MSDEESPEEPEYVEMMMRVPATPGAAGYLFYVPGSQPYELELPRSLRKRKVQIPGSRSVPVAVLILGEALHVYETMQYKPLMPEEIEEVTDESNTSNSP